MILIRWRSDIQAAFVNDWNILRTPRVHLATHIPLCFLFAGVECPSFVAYWLNLCQPCLPRRGFCEIADHIWSFWSQRAVGRRLSNSSVSSIGWLAFIRNSSSAGFSWGSSTYRMQAQCQRQVMRTLFWKAVRPYLSCLYLSSHIFWGAAVQNHPTSVKIVASLYSKTLI